jgi:hypothetical protein
MAVSRSGVGCGLVEHLMLFLVAVIENALTAGKIVFRLAPALYSTSRDA